MPSKERHQYPKLCTKRIRTLCVQEVLTNFISKFLYRMVKDIWDYLPFIIVWCNYILYASFCFCRVLLMICIYV